jgi:hypothetical protein
MSDTPRTDIAQHNMGSIVEPHYVVDADFSRYLERELAEAKKDADRYRWLRAWRYELSAGLKFPDSETKWIDENDLDAAIDTAMKECGK